MKILYVTSVFPRWEGDATPSFVENQARLMVEKGYEIRVIAPHAKGAMFREKRASLSIRRYPYAFPFGLEQLCYEGGMLIRLKSAPWVGLLLPFLLFAQFAAVAWECFRWRPHLIHSHSLLPQGLVGSVVGILFNIKHLSTSHGNDVFGLRASGFMATLKRLVLRQADGITVNSLATRTKVLELDPTVSEKTWFVPAAANACQTDTDLVQKVQIEYRAKGEKLVAFVGRLIEEKGVFDLLDALEILERDKVNFSAVILGDGPAARKMSAQIARGGLADRVHLIGWRPSEEISSWMAAADVLVVPSKPVGTWQEAQGLVVVEAMGVGTPVVASRLGGIPDMVKNYETGFLVEPGSGKEIAEKVEAVISGALTLDRRHLICFFKENYGLSIVADKTHALYREIMSSEK